MHTTGTDKDQELVLLLLRVVIALAAFHGHSAVEQADLHQAALALQKLETRGRDRVGERQRPRQHLRKVEVRGRKIDVRALVS